MQKEQFLQENILGTVRKARIPVTMFLVNGFQLRGTVQAYDNFTVLLSSEGKQQMIYKHAISTITPLKVLDLPEGV